MKLSEFLFILCSLHNFLTATKYIFNLERLCRKAEKRMANDDDEEEKKKGDAFPIFKALRHCKKLFQ